MMGIGGTGVVTVNQMLGTAALLDGKQRRAASIRQALSQKGGPVVCTSRSGETAADVAEQGGVPAAPTCYLGFDRARGDGARESDHAPARLHDRRRVDQPGADGRDGHARPMCASPTPAGLQTPRSTA